MEDELRRRMVLMLPKMRAFGLSLARSGPEADDLVQATCERALKSLHTFQPGTNFDAWLLRILRNLWIDGFRRRKGETLVDTSDPVNDREGEDGRDVTEARLTLDAVTIAMNALPEDQRSALVLVCVEGMSYRETADILDIPIGTVMSRLARARAAIATAVGYGSNADDARRASSTGAMG